MATSVLVSTLWHARVSWRGQLVLLLAGGVLAGLVSLLGNSQVFVAPVLMLLLLACAVGVADRGAGPDAPFLEAAEGLRTLPRVLAQVAIATAPMAIFGWGTLQLAGAVPLLGLPLIVCLFPFALATSVVATLATVATVRGDRAWVPALATRVFLDRPWALLGAFLVGGFALGMAAVPIVLVGFVLMSTLGWLGVLAFGIASAAIVPLAGCWALALFLHYAGERGERPVRVVDEPPVPDVAVAFEVAASPWVAGPAWDAQLDPAAPWGTWVQLPTTAQVALQVTWHGAIPPLLAIGREDGSWTAPIELPVSGALVPVTMLAGNSYVQLTGRDVAPQPARVVLHARAGAAA